jgi:hypothetical protein
MRVLAARELLEVWDRGADQAPAVRALALLAGACPETPAEELAGLPIGRRDALLLELRERTFGPDLVSVASCPGCGERLESAFQVAALLTAPSAEGDGPFELTTGGWTVCFRLPNSLDSVALATSPVDGDAGRALLGRCVLAAEQDGLAATAAGLPEEIVRDLGARMEQLDPQADVRIVLGCPACGHRCESVFDILPFFWTEIGAWAERVLYEVHVLASAYGWREPDVLALGPIRRQLYLRMVGA